MIEIINERIALSTDFTFGCEAEFYVTGIHELYRTHVLKTSKILPNGDVIKKVNNLSLNELILYFYPNRIDKKEKNHDNSAIMESRLIEFYFEEYEQKRPIKEIWNILTKKYSVLDIIIICDFFPKYDFKIEDANRIELFELVNKFNNTANFDILKQIGTKYKNLEIILGNDKDKKETYLIENESVDIVLGLLADIISKKIGEKVNYTSLPELNPIESENYSTWLLTIDESLKYNDFFNNIGLELVSPKMSINKSKDCISKVFSIINDFSKENKLKAYTDETTGFHINIGFEKDIDLVKLLVFLGDDYIINKFKRKDNINTVSSFKYMLNNFNKIIPEKLINSFYDITSLDQDDINYTLHLLKNSMSYNKLVSVNLSKLSKHKFIEFRAVGNKDYEKKENDVDHVLDNINRALTIAINKDLLKNDYLKKIYKILQTTINSNDKKINDINDNTVDLINNIVLKSKIMNFLERKDRVIANNWASITNELEKYSKTGVLNTYKYKMSINNLISSIRLYYSKQQTKELYGKSTGDEKDQLSKEFSKFGISVSRQKKVNNTLDKNIKSQINQLITDLKKIT